jgi:hypothetical protein
MRWVKKKVLDPILKVVGSWVEILLNKNQGELERKEY